MALRLYIITHGIKWCRERLHMIIEEKTKWVKNSTQNKILKQTNSKELVWKGSGV